MMRASASARAFWEALVLNFFWMNVSEVARYFLVVKPMMGRAFAEVPGIVPNTPTIGALWTVWDLLLIGITTVICWMVLERYRPTWLWSIGAGTLVWVSVFLLLWLGLHNMGLATTEIMFAALPLAWAELVIASLLVGWRMRAASQPGERIGAIAQI
jgi:hypothetical protein